MDESIKQKLYSGSLWVVGIKLLAFPVGLVLIALLTRILSAEEMGVYFLISSLVEFLVLFSLLGMEKSIIRIVSQSLALHMPGRAWKAVRQVLSIGIFSATVVAAFVSLGFGKFISEKVFTSPLMSETVYYSAIWLILLTIQRLISESFRGLHDIRFATLFNGVIQNFLCIFVLSFLYLMNVPIHLSTTLLIVIGAYAVNLLVGYATLSLNSSRFGKEGSIDYIEILKISWPLYFSTIFLTGLQKGHLWLLGLYSTPESVALYGSASRLLVMLTATIGIVRLVIPAMVAKLYAEKKYADLERILRSTATIAGVPSILALLIILFFGKTILLHLYGEVYSQGNTVLTVLAIAHIVNLLTGVPGVLLAMSSKEKALLKISLFSGSLSIIMSLILVSKLDYMGVAIGEGVGIVVQNLLMAFYCFKVLKINTFMSFREIYFFKKTLLSIVATHKQRFTLKTNSFSENTVKVEKN